MKGAKSTFVVPPIYPTHPGRGILKRRLALFAFLLNPMIENGSLEENHLRLALVVALELKELLQLESFKSHFQPRT
ncbi:hypothetical protein C5167_043228 [Papaver somniferum]|uniref:Uncharacterized protein n=1 Tax=Papaver somniferum TaxID=3469 RepID=A0A4Y7L925_PAPSO|nr:hypothetical protein C5167_043228 [Papaver somniferum]